MADVKGAGVAARGEPARTGMAPSFGGVASTDCCGAQTLTRLREEDRVTYARHDNQEPSARRLQAFEKQPIYW